MSAAQQLRNIQQQMAELQARADQLAQSPEVRRELEFSDKFQVLLRDYGYGLAEAVAIIDPQVRLVPADRRVKAVREGADASTTSRGTPRKRKQQVVMLRTYRNPKTGEQVEVANSLARPVRDWIKEHGKDTVKGWIVGEREKA